MKIKKSLLTVVVLTIFLFGVAALANPITILNGVFNSVKSSIFKTESQTHLQNIEIQATSTPSTEISKKVIQTSRNSVSNGLEIETPEHILWGVIFRQPEKYEKIAEAARQRGKSDALWTDGFVGKTKLSLENAEIFKEKASEYSKELLPITERSREIGLIYKLARENKKRVANDKALIKELSELQEKRKELTLKYRDEFHKAIDEEAFKAFEEWLKTEFVKNFHTTRISGKDIYKAKVERGEISSTGKNIPEDHHK